MTGRRAAAAVFLAAIVLRVTWLLAQGPEPRFAMSPDSHGYVKLALNLRERAAFSLDEEAPFTPDTIRTPGYPALLSAFSGPRPALWAQALLGSAGCSLVVLAAASLGAPPAAAGAAGMILATDLVSVAFTGQILTDVLFMFLLALALFALSRGRFGWAGLAAGAGALARPIGLYLPFPLAAVTALVAPPGRRASLAALLLATGLFLPTAWIARNKAQTGVATFSSIQGLNAMLRAAVVNTEATGKSYSESYAELDAKMREGKTFESSAEEAQEAGRFAAAFIGAHPIAYLRVCAKDVLKLFGGTGLDVVIWSLLKDPRYDPMAPDVVSGGFSGTRQQLERHPGLKVVLAAYWAFLVAFYALAARGAWRLWKEKRFDALSVAGVPLLYFLALTLGMGAYYRLRLPLLPPLALLAAFGLQRRLPPINN